MNILAIDPSLTGTGFAYRDRKGKLVVQSIVQKEGRGMGRLTLIASIVKEAQQESAAKLLVIEGYAFGFAQKGTRSHSLGEIGGIIRYVMWERGADILVVPPHNLKKFMIGHANNTINAQTGRKVKAKDLVKTAAEEHAGRTFASTDQADAYVLLLMGEGHADPRLLPRLRSHYQRVSLEGCDLMRNKRRAEART